VRNRISTCRRNPLSLALQLSLRQTTLRAVGAPVPGAVFQLNHGTISVRIGDHSLHENYSRAAVALNVYHCSRLHVMLCGMRHSLPRYTSFRPSTLPGYTGTTAHVINDTAFAALASINRRRDTASNPTAIPAASRDANLTAEFQCAGLLVSSIPARCARGRVAAHCLSLPSSGFATPVCARCMSCAQPPPPSLTPRSPAIASLNSSPSSGHALFFTRLPGPPGTPSQRRTSERPVPPNHARRCQRRGCAALRWLAAAAVHTAWRRLRNACFAGLARQLVGSVIHLFNRIHSEYESES
jgi:hypothetical protein